MTNFDLLERFVESRDYEEEPIIAAFGYGSGVFRQSANPNTVIDMFFVVKDARNWNLSNIENNPNDYSLTGRIMLTNFDLNRMKKLTGVTYQHNVPFDGERFKYGVVNESRFLRNLRLWDSFFIPGRFQKPIQIVRGTEATNQAMEQNRESVLLTALMTLPVGEHSLKDLYTQICGLSYHGDIRMAFAEDPNKIKNIVDSNYFKLFEMYGASNRFFHTLDDGKIVIDYDELWNSLQELPDYLFNYLIDNGYLHRSHEEISEGIRKYLAKVNRRDSIAQPITGLITVGPISSACYLGQKIKKRFH